METLPTAHPMNNTVPTGGVSKPIPKFNISTIPKCTGSMPSEVTTGSRIGVMIRIKGAISMPQPNTSSNKLIMSKIMIGLDDMCSKDSVTNVGTFR
ncbi:hypothetical protein D3C84_1016840 [compost metagenome]